MIARAPYMANCESLVRMYHEAFWDNGFLVCKAAGCVGVPFKAGRGVTQGRPVSPTIFNLMVDAIIRDRERLLSSAASRWARSARSSPSSTRMTDSLPPAIPRLSKRPWTS